MSVQTYTVTEIVSSREWAPPDDPSKKTVFYDFNAQETDKRCSIGRKPDNPLQVGESFEASVKSEKNGTLNLKREQQGGFNGKRDPATEKRITRQHSQDMAIETLKLAHSLGHAPELDSVKAIVGAVKTLAEVYDKDAWEAGS